MNKQVEIKAATIATALAAAQMEMGKALKNANNPHFRSKYADLGNVMDACLPALNAHGIAMIQPTGEDEFGRFVKTVLIHGDSGETLECRVPLIVSKNDMQGYGSAVTYARRYGLMAMAGIAPEDDDGNAAVKAAPTAIAGGDKIAFAPAAAAKRIRSKLSAVNSLDALSEAFGSERQVINEIKAADRALYTQIITLKDQRKAELSPPQDDLDDEIPY